MDLNQKRSKVFYGWYIVAACLLIILYTNGIVFYGFTAVFKPIADEFSWSYTEVSLAASLRGFEVGLLAPLMGLLVDRWGPRKLIFGGGILICLGFLTLSRVTSLLMFYGAFALIAIGMSAFTQTVIMTAIANWFRRRAPLAIGIVASAFGLGGLMVPVLARLVDVYQWRTAVAIVGLGMLVIVLPLSLIVRHRPEHYGYKPDGDAGSTVDMTGDQLPVASTETNITALQAIKNRAFWHVAIASMFHSFVVGAVVTHMMPYLTSLGVHRSVSSLVALILPVASIGGRLSSSVVADRLGNKHVFTTSFVLMTAGLLFFWYVNNGMMWLLVPFIITFSLGWGFSVTTRISLLRERFGRGYFGMILGSISGIMMLGNISGAPLAGWIFDTWGSYKGAWLVFSALTIISAVLALTIPSPSNADRRSDPSATEPVTK